MTREAVTEHSLTDEDLARLVTEALAWDSRIHYPHIRVTADNGVIYLGGIVERLTEKTAAEEDASRIAGVTQVISNILVKPESIVTDSSIEESVRDALRRDARVDTGDFEVESRNGIVTLRGEVIMLSQKWAALDDTALTYGVQGVVDQIAVIPAQPVGDHEIEEIAGAILRRIPAIDADRIHAHVVDGIVHLRGSVDFLYLRSQVEHAIRDTPGIRGIVNELAVNESE